MPDPADDLIERLLHNVRYEGSPKHKRHPQLFDLEPFNGKRDDATLCDEADFSPDQIDEIPALVERGIRAGLIGHTARLLWTVADDGWIFEARETNRETTEFHGYPVLPEESIAAPRIRPLRELGGSPRHHHRPLRRQRVSTPV